MNEHLTVPRATWDALREALENWLELDSSDIDRKLLIRDTKEALTAANAVSDHFRGVTEMVQPLGWYCVSRDGLATQCADQRDAELTAKSANRDWPNSAPYRAVQLCEFEANPQATEPAPTTPEAAGYVMSAAPGRRCTYDNRVTMARECWEDGRLVFSVSSEMLWDVQNHGHPIVKRLHEFLPILQGGWRGGKIKGDSKALQQST